MSVIPPKADIHRRRLHVRFVPEADTASVTKVSREDGAACLQVLCAKKTQETMSQVPSHFVPRSRTAAADSLVATYREVASMQGEPPMKTLVSIITLGLAVAFAAPAFAADKAPTSKSACEKAHMTWDATAKKCK